MPWMTTVKGVRIAFLAFSQISELSATWVATDSRPGVALAFTQQQIDRAAASVRAAKSMADVVVVFMHWGQERNTCPIALQRTAARAFADAGATIVMGTHAHVMQGDGWLGQTYVAYGMSNFVWYINSQNDTGVIRVTLSGSTWSRPSSFPRTSTARLASRSPRPAPRLRGSRPARRSPWVHRPRRRSLRADDRRRSEGG